MVEELPLVIVLNMSKCKLSFIPRNFIKTMRNLLSLDLSFNKIRSIRKDDFLNKANLVHLDLSGNYKLSLIEPYSLSLLVGIKRLAITDSKLKELHANTFSSLDLVELQLSKNRLETVHNLAFADATIAKIDIRQNIINTFHSEMFKGVAGLKTLLTDAYKFCCIKPETVADENCFPQRDEFSSCEDMVREEALRFLLWVIGVLALVGNVISFLYRLRFDRKRLKLGYGVFVTNLAVADLLMGIYLLIIAVGDVIFRGRYIAWDYWWRQSVWCSMAGVMSAISSEASVLFICLITLDRILVIKYPFGDFRFNTKNALITSGAVWLIVIVVATAPMGFEDGQFYTRSPVCLALPLTRDRPP
ncbi:MAG: 7 transmembrane receptor, partial [Candidatus Thiodiazotropha taylori]|nr:7 transmembrane receptor [Candidatus Thiodiazotropha taylori]MCW4336608.1 7 transmembrane receptor [Candidatus Thiodiazotropha endolucinida]